jgi:glutathione peroxidase
MTRALITLFAVLFGFHANALDLNAPFESIDGGTLSLEQWSGQPVLVVNTASRCGYTKQYEGLQTLYETYQARGLVVLAVPSDDFRQELSSNAEIKDFCEIQFGIDLPMTGITRVKGPNAHPFYRSLKAENGFTPTWNFNKVLIGPDGKVIATYGSKTKPTSLKIRQDIEKVLK